MTQSYLSSASEALAARPEVAEGALATLVTEKEFRYQVSRAGWKTKDIEHAIDARPRVEGKIVLTADDVTSRWNPDRETMRRIAQASESRPPGRDSLRPYGAALVSTISAAPSGCLEVDW